MRCILVAHIAMLFAIPAIAQEPVTIRLKLHSEPGNSQTQTDVSTDKGSMKIFDGDGKMVAEIKPGGSKTTSRDTVLTAEKDGKPSRFLRTFDKATETEDGKTKTFTYQGRTLLYEKGKDGKYRIGVVGKGEIDRKEAEKLLEKANKPSDSEAILEQLDPKKPVKIGDSWSMDVKPLAKSMDAKVDEKKSTMTAKLKSVATKGKTEFGTFEFDIRLVVTAMTDPIDMTFDPPAELTMKGTVELAIDGSSTASTAKFAASLKGDAKWSKDGAKGGMSFDVSGEINAVASAETKAADAGKVPMVTWLAAAGEWSGFKPKDSSFKVEFPAGPKEENTKNPRGDATSQWTASTDAGAVAYVVATTDFAGAATGKVDAKLILDAVAKNQKDPMNLKDIKQDGFPGIEFNREEETRGKKLEYHHRVVMVGGRMYQQIVIAEKGKVKPENIEKFFKSFQILEKPKKKDD